jgi:protein-tyrosine phosphatase
MMEFWKKKQARPIPVAVDLHSHLLPNLDDGVRSMEEAVEIVRTLSERGFRKIITTPHIMSDFYPNSEEEILRQCAELSAAVRKADIDMEISAAAEYYLDEIFLDKLLKGRKMLTFGRKYLMFETSFINEPAFLKEAVFRINTMGYRPVLAHPERYMYLAANPQRIDELLKMQLLFQLNLISITGYYSGASKKLAMQLMEKGAIHFVGSDCHNSQQLAAYLDAWQHKNALLLEKCNLLNNSLIQGAAPGGA